MHALERTPEIGDELVEIFSERFAAPDQHIIVPGAKVTRASCHSGTKAAFDAIALGRIARLLGDGEPNPRVGRIGLDGLQPKRRPPGAIAPGSPLKLGSFA